MRPVLESYPLTPVQQGMLFHWLEGSNVGVDIEQMVGELRETIDPQGLEQAWQLVADRHAILRTGYRWAGLDEPIQEVANSMPVALDVQDLRGVEAPQQQDTFDRFLAADRRLGFELDQAPLWRITLFLLDDALAKFVFTYHHSLLDTSVVWVVEEAFTAYDAAAGGTAVALEDRLAYRDHIAWLQDHLEADRDAAKTYFADLLAGYDEPIQLTALEQPQEAVIPEQSDYRHDRFELTTDLSEAVHAFAAQHKVGPPVLIEAAWALLLSAYSGSPDVVFGSTRGCRRSGLAGSDNIVGLFINTPPVRVAINPSQTVVELLADIRRQQVDKRAHEHTALTDIQPPGPPLFETIVVVNELHQGTRLANLGGAFANRDFDLHDQTNTPLNLLAFTDPQIHFKLSYDLRRFAPEPMARVRELFVALLTAMVATPEGRVADLPRLTEHDRKLIATWNSTELDYPHSATVADLFEQQVDRTPDAPALVFRADQLTYRELDERANMVAAHLVGLGVGPDSLVGVFMDRSVEMMVALLGILKAGGAYVPMDPHYPSTRIEMMLEDANCAVVITDPDRRAAVPEGVADVITVTDIGAAPADRPARADLDSDHLAYVIFTSGSTGRPKGVQIEQRNVVNFLAAMDVSLGYDDSNDPGVWLAVTSISFDISVLELFWSLTRGFKLILQEEESLAVGGGSDELTRPMDFSLFYFADDANTGSSNPYNLLIEGAKFADQHDFTAVWTPERHFHEFGGLYPNPALTSMAIAMVTEQISIRAGSVVLALHNPIRCAEDWAMVDNLSNGRVGLSFAAGWHANDFALAPDNYDNRKQVMMDGIETIRSLWRGESVSAIAGDGRDIEVSVFPKPVQAAPPIWITTGGSPATFEMAGKLGAFMLTNLLVMSEEELADNIARYRAAYTEAGHPGNGHISVMLHTFVGQDIDEVREVVREPFLHYLRTSTDLVSKMQWELTSFAKPELVADDSPQPELSELSAEDVAAIMDHAFERYFHSAGLFGTPDSCRESVARLSNLGVDELACLIDFGVDEKLVLESLVHLDTLRQSSNGDVGEALEISEIATEQYGLIDQMERHGVTHFQCTPSHGAAIASTPEGMAALAKVDKLLFGGEALPASLVDRVRPQIRGDLLNMYGPTETTIWSSVSPIIAAGRPITIGHPIANTQIFIVDRNLQENPIGVAGELLIGGDGVVRGYLDRPELTDEKFVSLPAANGERVYRTGDLARLLDDGEIEFGGRLDQQVKIRGYRIELGEVETAIGKSDGVFENVVVSRPDSTGAPQLVAYVVGQSDGADGVATDWGDLWNETYGADQTADPEFDTAGWNDSYSGDPIPVEEMREWTAQTVARIKQLSPRQVLEVGCGTGLLLFRIAPDVEGYVGIDLAQNALDRIGQRLQERSVGSVELICGEAHDLASLVDGSFDTIIVNSVAQYFPSADYLVDVIRQAMTLLAPGGSLFLGDLRSKAQAPLFAADIELSRASADTTTADLAARSSQREAQDHELVIDPDLFRSLGEEVPDLAEIDVQLRGDSFDNEMSRFRYDVVLRRGDASGASSASGGDAVVEVVSEAVDRTTVDSIRSGVVELVDAQPAIVRVPAIRNDRLVRSAELTRLLAQADRPGTVAEIRQALDDLAPGVKPSELADLVPGYRTSIEWSEDAEEHFDLVLRSTTQPSRSIPPTLAAPTDWSALTNTPAAQADASLAPRLREHLRSVLPDFMVPTVIVVLDALPRTPNGKIDRNALPEPDRARSESLEAVVPADNDLERTIADTWAGLLSLDEVGVETNIFDIGANSLLVVRASSKLSETLGKPVSLVDMFKYPTIRSLAKALNSDAANSALSESTARGASRKDAMSKRRELRRRGRK